VSLSCDKPSSIRQGNLSALHSFPTRRSSDLAHWRRIGAGPLGKGIPPDQHVRDARSGSRGGARFGAIKESHRFRDRAGVDASFEIGRAHVYSSHVKSSYAVLCLKKKIEQNYL